MERQRKRGKKRYLFLHGFVFTLYILTVLMLFREWMFRTIVYPYIVAGDFMVYSPFSRKLFEVSPEEIETVDVRVWLDAHNTDQKTMYSGQASPAKLAEFMGSFRYIWWGNLKSDITPEKGRGNIGRVEINGPLLPAPTVPWALSARTVFRYGENYIKFDTASYWPNGKIIDMMTVKFYCSPEEIARLDAICREACGLEP